MSSHQSQKHAIYGPATAFTGAQVFHEKVNDCEPTEPEKDLIYLLLCDDLVEGVTLDNSAAATTESGGDSYGGWHLLHAASTGYGSFDYAVKISNWSPTSLFGLFLKTAYCQQLSDQRNFVVSLNMEAINGLKSLSPPEFKFGAAALNMLSLLGTKLATEDKKARITIKNLKETLLKLYKAAYADELPSIEELKEKNTLVRLLFVYEDLRHVIRQPGDMRPDPLLIHRYQKDGAILPDGTVKPNLILPAPITILSPSLFEDNCLISETFLGELFLNAVIEVL